MADVNLEHYFHSNLDIDATIDVQENFDRYFIECISNQVVGGHSVMCPIKC